nr:hypothetical protein CFP56_08943 [Quercus suber]POE65796.1 hypothetical protein CFP56_38266 [Quercus suber]POE69667.1 hypothetical protein CFP56_62562 [Quercus suber]POE91042.1 hypothetical protein CFP56_45719 [Quercus suber]POF00795.1 hypothetical protein CFP56_70911 [Quercus suber]
MASSSFVFLTATFLILCTLTKATKPGRRDSIDEDDDEMRWPRSRFVVGMASLLHTQTPMARDSKLHGRRSRDSIGPWPKTPSSTSHDHEPPRLD